VAVLNTIRYGDPAGAPLLALHGITGHARRWEHLGTGAWAHRAVLAVDLRGHGFSTWAPPWSMAQMVEDVLDTLDAADAEGLHAPYDVLGQSYGGLIALHLLAVEPARVRRIVLLDPGLVREPDLMEREAEWLLATDGWATREEALRHRNAGLGEAIHPDVLVEAEQHLVQGEDGRFRFRFSRAAVIAALSELARPLPSLATPRPTLLVAAQRPRIVRPEVSAALGSQLGSHYREIAVDCGHMVHWERPTQTAELVDEFLSS
jgi:lipase